ncbi:unnamed protein product [Boreogadus saida]
MRSTLVQQFTPTLRRSSRLKEAAFPLAHHTACLQWAATPFIVPVSPAWNSVGRLGDFNPSRLQRTDKGMERAHEAGRARQGNQIQRVGSPPPPCSTFTITSGSSLSHKITHMKEEEEMKKRLTHTDTCQKTMQFFQDDPRKSSAITFKAA